MKNLVKLNKLVSHSNWDTTTQRSILKDKIPRKRKTFSKKVPLFELQVSGVTGELSPFLSDVKRALHRSSGLCKVFKIDQTLGRKISIIMENRRPKNKPFTIQQLAEKIRRNHASN